MANIYKYASSPIIQCGLGTMDTSGVTIGSDTITFPVAFSAPPFITCTPLYPGTSVVCLSISSISATQFTCHGWFKDGAPGSTGGASFIGSFHYVAVAMA